jgi:putative heme-binding domain-containing protein
MAKTGPDGALYFADMYRLVIEHPEYFPDELKQRPDLRAGADKGRIYRIYPQNAQLRVVPKLNQLDTSGLVAALDSPNGWQRDTVQKMLVQSHDLKAVPGLEHVVKYCANPKARLQALCILQGLQSVSFSILMSALQDSHWAVRREAVVQSESRFSESPDLDKQFSATENDMDLRVRYQLAFSLGGWKGANAGEILGRLMLKDWQNEEMQTALLSSAPLHIEQIIHEVFLPAKANLLKTGLVERLVDLAVQIAQEGPLLAILDKIENPVGGSYAPWQIAGLAGLLTALDRQNVSLADFETRASPGLKRILSSLGPLFDQSQNMVDNTNSSEAEQLIAIRLLARRPEHQQQDIARLGNFLGPRNSTSLQKASLTCLRRLKTIEVADVLLKNWRTLGLIQRQDVLNTLCSRSEWTQVLLAALEQGKVLPGEIGALQQQKLLRSEERAIRERASRLFASTNSDRKTIIASYAGVEQLSGNRSKGHDLFTKNCSICHRLKGEGQGIGPDLGTVADKPVQELIVAILDPNQAVDPAYVAYTAETRDDRELSGILASENSNSIVLRLAGGSEEEILRSNVKQLTSSGRSLMPEGFETGLKPQDLADLIAYVLNPAL